MDQGTPAFAANKSMRNCEIPLELFAPAVRAAISGDGLGVVRLVHPDSGRRLDLQLFCHDQFQAEGELTLAVRDVETDLMLAGLTFSLVLDEGERVAIIGCLQAGSDPRARGLSREVAKDLFGLRPKALVLWCLQQLTLLWDIREIQAVGDQQRVLRHWRERLEVAAHHDDFWRESDGRRLPGGEGWQLPLTPRFRTRDEIKPSRRRAYERRYAMLAGLQPTLIAAFAALAPGAEQSRRAAAGPVEHICSPLGAEFRGAGTLPASDLLATNHSF
jgi:hypothetical protein